MLETDDPGLFPAPGEETLACEVPVADAHTVGLRTDLLDAFHALLASRDLMRDALSIALPGQKGSHQRVPAHLRDRSLMALKKHTQLCQRILALCEKTNIRLEKLTVGELRLARQIRSR